MKIRCVGWVIIAVAYLYVSSCLLINKAVEKHNAKHEAGQVKK